MHQWLRPKTVIFQSVRTCAVWPRVEEWNVYCVSAETLANRSILLRVEVNGADVNASASHARGPWFKPQRHSIHPLYLSLKTLYS